MSERNEIEKTRSKPEYTPATDIYEDGEKYTVVCDMPGVDQDGVSVSLEDNVLSVTGEQQELDRERFYHQEYAAGIFHRVFRIPDMINRGAIKATIKNGVLTVTLPKAEKEKPKTITVEAA